MVTLEMEKDTHLECKHQNPLYFRAGLSTKRKDFHLLDKTKETAVLMMSDCPWFPCLVGTTFDIKKVRSFTRFFQLWST